MTKKDTKSERELTILKAAGKIFAQYGLRKTSLDDIAKAVGLVKASLYYYFESKEELFRAVLRHESEIMIKKLRNSINKKPSPQEKLKSYSITKINYMKELINLYRLTTDAAQELLPLIEKERRQFFKAEKTLVIEILEEGVKKNIFKIDNLEFAALAIIASIRGLGPTLLLYQNRNLRVSDYDSMLNFIFNGVLND